MKTTTMNQMTARHTFISKLSSITLLLCILFTAFAFKTKAANEYLVTLLIIPDKNITYTDYDTAYLTLICNNNGKSYSYKLYPYNNFSDKVVLPEGEYSVISAGINGQNDRIFEIEADDVTVDSSTAIVAKLHDTNIITPTTTKKVIVSEATTKPTQTTTKEFSTLFSDVEQTSEKSDSSSVLTTENSNTTTHTQPNDNTATKLPEPTSTTSNPDNSSNESHHSTRKNLAVAVVVGISFLTIICILFFLLIYKKNKEN